MKKKIEFKHLFDSRIYDSFFGREDELSHSKMTLLLTKDGWYKVVSEYEKYHIEKQRIGLGL